VRRVTADLITHLDIKLRIINPTELVEETSGLITYVNFIPKEGTLRAHFKFPRMGEEIFSKLKPNKQK
jgi:hypothetical protein